jgi:hypothetical protein
VREQSLSVTFLVRLLNEKIADFLFDFDVA